ncbi:GNAT family N-acetyltransferase [Nonomuraea fuscirosea]|uniref:GNAT family N-acetyltransferase n=1 Tax=Nonomuraea fuscirosea TaxID=1291556 RepID=UPI003424E7D9
MHTIGRPRPDDAGAIHELVAASDIAVIGAPDSTPEDIADDLVEPGFDLDRDAWLARDPDGRVDGWAWAVRNGESDLIDVEVIVRPGVTGLEERLWEAVLARAAEHRTDGGFDAVTLHVGVYRADEAKRARMRDRGFEPGTSYHRMRIDHDGPLEPPAAPPGLTMHSGLDEQVRREGHRVHQEGFAAHFGFVATPYELWHERREAMSVTDWSQLALARIDGRPAGVVIGNDAFLSDEGCGYVTTLAVLPEFRGRGLGRFLLRHAFAADAAAGRKGTILHVDSNNTTPALGLYESAGMRRVMAIDVWRRRL